MADTMLRYDENAPNRKLGPSTGQKLKRESRPPSSVKNSSRRPFQRIQVSGVPFLLQLYGSVRRRVLNWSAFFFSLFFSNVPAWRVVSDVVLSRKM